jgi:hypothetical protein
MPWAFLLFILGALLGKIVSVDALLDPHGKRRSCNVFESLPRSVDEPTMKLTTIAADTTPDAAWVQVKIYRRMSVEQRLQLTLGMSRSLGNIAAAGVRLRHPEYTEEQVKYAVIRLRLGEELFRKAFPGVKLP